MPITSTAGSKYRYGSLGPILSRRSRMGLVRTPSTWKVFTSSILKLRYFGAGLKPPRSMSGQISPVLKHRATLFPVVELGHQLLGAILRVGQDRAWIVCAIDGLLNGIHHGLDYLLVVRAGE